MKFKEKFAKFRKSKTFKVATSVFISAMISCMLCLNCFAAEIPAETDSLAQVQTTLSTSYSTMSDSVLTMINNALPYVIPCVAAYFIVRKGISFFVGLAKKG